jgi:hypothetical protein
MGSTLKAALYYAKERQWPVVPIWPTNKTECECEFEKCRNPGKHPIASIGGKEVVPNGLKDATTDGKMIRKWWKLCPNANIGIRGDKFFALDVDDNDALFFLEDEYEKLPDTVESISGSGGRHLLFNQPAESILGNEEGDLPDGINVRGHRGYIVVPPSTHKSGKRYVWEASSHPKEVEVADAPDWLLKLIGEPRVKPNVVEITCADSVPDVDKLDMNPFTKDLIKHGPSEDEDRSKADQRAICALLGAGCTREQVKGYFSKYPIGTLGKYSERGDGYLDRSIASAIAYMGLSEESLVESKIVPGKQVTEKEAELETKALNTAYIKGWTDALKSNSKVIAKMWPDYVGINNASIGYYDLGLRKDFQVKENDNDYAALVVPFHASGKVKNIEYNLYKPPANTPLTHWEIPTATNVFDTDLDGSKLSGSVLITEDWDTAIHTYLRHGTKIDTAVIGLPSLPAGSDPVTKKRHLQALASLLADSERILLAWPASRRKEARALAGLLENGGERVRWLGMPFNMRDMYTKFNLQEVYLKRFLDGAVPV